MSLKLAITFSALLLAPMLALADGECWSNVDHDDGGYCNRLTTENLCKGAGDACDWHEGRIICVPGAGMSDMASYICSPLPGNACTAAGCVLQETFGE